MKETKSEIDAKLVRLRNLMVERALGAVVLHRTASVAWITGGASTWVNTANGEGPVTAIITPDTHLLVTSSIEAPRLIEEERLPELGWPVVVEPWYAPSAALSDALATYADSSQSVGSDVPLDRTDRVIVNIGGDLARLRARLLPQEQKRASDLGADCAAAMARAVEHTQPGETEFEIAAHLWNENQRRGIQSIVTLVATDLRIEQFRHPLPTSRRLERYAMLVSCGRRAGLVSSITRLVHFGPIPEEIRLRHHAVATIDSNMIAETRAGRSMGEMFAIACREYANAGYREAWEDHHQGGVIAYEPREYFATPDGVEVLEAGMTCAWNPSLPGAKSEDTILVDEAGSTILTAVEGWPQYEPVADGPLRPMILER